MSEERKITLNLDLNIIQETAKALGYKVTHKGQVRLYHRLEDVDLAVELPGTNYSLGFIKTTNGVEMIHDNMINEQVNHFIIETYKTTIEKKLSRSRFKLQSQTSDKKAVVLRYAS